MTSELKPCPFCGSVADVVEQDKSFYICCSACYCEIGQKYDSCGMPEHYFAEKEAAIAAWNTRAMPAGTRQDSWIYEYCGMAMVRRYDAWR